MIIFTDLMVQLFLSSDFKRQVLQWYGVTVPMKEPRGLLGQKYLTSREMCKVVMQTAETVPTREANERLMNSLGSTYAKADLQQVAANTIPLNAEERTLLLRLLQYFEDLFGGTLGDWDIEPVNLEFNPYSKPFKYKYDLVPIINKENFLKELQ